jgi:hypothetical protein
MGRDEAVKPRSGGARGVSSQKVRRAPDRARRAEGVVHLDRVFLHGAVGRQPRPVAGDRGEAPGSLDELPRITGKAKSNLSRTLRTLAGYGLVRLERGERGRITPKVTHDRVELDLPLTVSRKAAWVRSRVRSWRRGRPPRTIDLYDLFRSTGLCPLVYPLKMFLGRVDGRRKMGTMVGHGAHLSSEQVVHPPPFTSLVVASISRSATSILLIDSCNSRLSGVLTHVRYSTME